MALLRFRRDRGPVRGQDDAFLVVGVGAEDVPRVVRFVLLGTVANPEGGLSCGWVLGALVLGQNELMEKQVLRRNNLGIRIASIPFWPFFQRMIMFP